MKAKKKVKWKRTTNNKKLFVSYRDMREKYKPGQQNLLWNIFHRVDQMNRVIKRLPALLTPKYISDSGGSNENPKKIKLPKFELPTSVDDAANKTKQLDVSLAKSFHEEAYKYGVYFGWIKKEVRHGKFIAWINANTRWTYRTVLNYRNYAEQCERAGYLLKYRPF